MKGRVWTAMILCILVIAAPAAAENVLINGELDDGFTGWYTGSQNAGCPADVVSASEPGEVRLYAAGDCMACVDAEQAFTVPATGWYAIRARFYVGHAFDGYCKDHPLRTFFQLWRPGAGYFWWQEAFVVMQSPPYGHWVEVEGQEWIESGWQMRVRVALEDFNTWEMDSEAELILDYVRIEWDDAVSVQATSWSTVKSLYPDEKS